MAAGLQIDFLSGGLPKRYDSNRHSPYREHKGSVASGPGKQPLCLGSPFGTDQGGSQPRQAGIPNASRAKAALHLRLVAAYVEDTSGGEAAMAHPNEELIRRSFQAFSKGDMEAVAASFADDVVWHTPGRGLLAGDYRGRDQVLGMLVKQAELTGGTFRAEGHDILANDEHAVLLAKVMAERGGKAWEDNGVVVFHIKNGKLSEAWLHPGDLYAGDDFFS